MIRSFKKSQKGAALIEYGMLVGLIAVLAIISVITTGGKVRDTFATVDDTLSTYIGGAVEPSGGSGTVPSGPIFPVADASCPEITPAGDYGLPATSDCVVLTMTGGQIFLDTNSTLDSEVFVAGSTSIINTTSSATTDSFVLDDLSRGGALEYAQGGGTTWSTFWNGLTYVVGKAEDVHYFPTIASSDVTFTYFASPPGGHVHSIMISGTDPESGRFDYYLAYAAYHAATGTDYDGTNYDPVQLVFSDGAMSINELFSSLVDPAGAPVTLPNSPMP